MPAWAPLFSQIIWDQDLGPIRLYNLARYLESKTVEVISKENGMSSTWVFAAYGCAVVWHSPFSPSFMHVPGTARAQQRSGFGRGADADTGRMEQSAS